MENQRDNSQQQNEGRSEENRNQGQNQQNQNDPNRDKKNREGDEEIKQMPKPNDPNQDKKHGDDGQQKEGQNQPLANINGETNDKRDAYQSDNQDSRREKESLEDVDKRAK